MTSTLKNNEGANGLSPLVLRPCHYSTAIHNSTHGLRTSQLGAHQHTASRPWSLSISLHPFSPPGIHNPSDSSIAMRHFRPIPRPTTLFFPLPGFVCGRVCHFTQTALTIWVPYQMHTRHPMPSSIHNSAPHNTPHPLGVLPCLIAILEILHTVHATRLCISHKRCALAARAALSSCLCTFTPCLSPAPAPYGGPPPAHSSPAVHFPRAHRHATMHAHAPPFTIP